MNDELISYLELCVRQKAHLQHGMNWRIQSTHSVFLMSTRKGSPYDYRIEQAVFIRDGGKCVKCGSSDNLHFDHILPYSTGGTSYSAENVQILCARHNLSKSAKII